MSEDGFSSITSKKVVNQRRFYGSTVCPTSGREWVPRVGHKGKLPTQRKAFRFRKEDVELLEELAGGREAPQDNVRTRSRKSNVPHARPRQQASAENPSENLCCEAPAGQQAARLSGC